MTMTQLARTFRLALLAACLTALGAYASAQLVAATPRDWTVIVYMNGKNSLELDALNNFDAMASVGGSDQVAIVTELGRPKKHYTSARGGWSGVYRFVMIKGRKPLPKEAVEKVPAGLASDMGEPDTLVSFIAWTRRKYPAKHYMVIVWNHGQGYRLMFSRLMANMSSAERARLQMAATSPSGKIGGYRAVSSDDDTHSILYNAEVASALAKNFSATDKLDLLGFDACLMSMMETAYALDQNVGLMVASEELEPGDGWQYRDWLSRLVADPTLSPNALGRAVVETYGTHYPESYTTMALLDLSHTRAAATQLSAFADAVRAAGLGEMQMLRAARSELSAYGDWYDPPSYLSVDLGTLLDRYRIRTGNAALATRAATTITAVNAMVVANYASQKAQGGNGEKLYGSKGVAIYYPSSAATFRDDPFHKGYLKANTDRPVAFVRDEHWADLLYDLLGVH